MNLDNEELKATKNRQDMELSKEEKETRIMKESLKGKYVIVRGYRSGVFFGIPQNQKGQEVELKECRRLWYWEGACSISELAVNGTAKPNKCKFTVTVDEIILTDAIEIIPCTDKSIESIKGVKEWKY